MHTDPTEQNKSERTTLRILKNLRRCQRGKSFEQFAIANTINNAKPSRAIGPDGLSMFMLNKLGEKALRFLFRLINIQPGDNRYLEGQKAFKPASKGKSYRPISLLSPVVKILVALLPPAFKRHFQLSEYQFGFREDHSITTATANELKQQ